MFSTTSGAALAIPSLMIVAWPVFGFFACKLAGFPHVVGQSATVSIQQDTEKSRDEQFISRPCMRCVLYQVRSLSICPTGGAPRWRRHLLNICSSAPDVTRSNTCVALTQLTMMPQRLLFGSPKGWAWICFASFYITSYRILFNTYIHQYQWLSSHKLIPREFLQLDPQTQLDPKVFVRGIASAQAWTTQLGRELKVFMYCNGSCNAVCCLQKLEQTRS